MNDLQKPTRENVPHDIIMSVEKIPETWQVDGGPTGDHRKEERLRMHLVNQAGESPIRCKIVPISDGNKTKVSIAMELDNAGRTDRLPQLVVEHDCYDSEEWGLAYSRKVDVMILGLLQVWRDGFTPRSWY